MEGTVTLPLTEYVELMDTVKQLQSQVEKYAEQIQKEYLSRVKICEWTIMDFELFDENERSFVTRNGRYTLNTLGITDKEIDAFLYKENTNE